MASEFVSGPGRAPLRVLRVAVNQLASEYAPHRGVMRLPAERKVQTCKSKTLFHGPRHTPCIATVQKSCGPKPRQLQTHARFAVRPARRSPEHSGRTILGWSSRASEKISERGRKTTEKCPNQVDSVVTTPRLTETLMVCGDRNTPVVTHHFCF
jgi:hypothetical protein